MLRTYSKPRSLLYDLTGKRYERLLVKELLGIYRSQSYWLCICDCGQSKEIRGDGLQKGAVKSCGCLRSEQNKVANFKHGYSGAVSGRHPMYHTWSDMVQRCTNPKAFRYDRYGGRGITVAPEWLDFEGFRRDMENTWSSGLSLEREDSNLGYNKNNCSWQTQKTQMDNTSRSLRFEYRGSTLTAEELAKLAGISRSAMYNRLCYHDITPEQAVNYSPRTYPKLSKPRNLEQYRKYQ